MASRNCVVGGRGSLQRRSGQGGGELGRGGDGSDARYLDELDLVAVV